MLTNDWIMSPWIGRPAATRQTIRRFVAMCLGQTESLRSSPDLVIYRMRQKNNFTEKNDEHSSNDSADLSQIFGLCKQ